MKKLRRISMGILCVMTDEQYRVYIETMPRNLMWCFAISLAVSGTIIFIFEKGCGT